MICPKCGFEQPEGPECLRCGIIISRYRGPAAGGGVHETPPAFSPGVPAPPAPFMPPPPVITGGTAQAPVPPPPRVVGGAVYGDPAPAAPGIPADPSGGTVYGGQPPSGGIVYGGQGSAAPAFSSFQGGPAFHGTFEPGKILGETFSTYFSNFIPFLLLSALVSLPMFLIAFYISSIQAKTPMAALFFLLALPLQLILSQVAAAGITYGVFQQMRGKDPSVIDCLRIGLSRVLPVILVAIVVGLAELVGFVFCVIPGIILAVIFSVAVPVTVEERPGPFDAMRRSSFLTEGYRWQVFAVLFILGVIQQILSRLALLTVQKDLGAILLVTSAVSILTIGLSSTAVAVMYYRLRSVKESIDVDQISSVFA